MERCAALRTRRTGASRPILSIDSAALVRCVLLLFSFGAGHFASGQELPDSPGALLAQRALEANPQTPFEAAAASTHQTTHSAPPAATTPQTKLPLCQTAAQTSSPEANAAEKSMAQAQPPCRPENPIQPIVTTKQIRPLTPGEKGLLAVRDTIDPFNLMTITGYSAIAIGINSHSAYGAGIGGWGRLSGYTFVEDAQGEFSGTFLICSLTHEDPRYHRLPNAPVARRLLHALSHTWVSQHDDGTPMPNYSTLLTYPISAELSNLYVPGVPTNLPSTARRVAIGLATDPSGTIVAEFLPDLAKRIHIHVIFIQEILNQVASGGTAPNVQ